MSATGVRVSPRWLVLREPADAAARSARLAERLAGHLSGTDRLVIHDLGGGSGAMGRWLAPRLSGPQHWVVHDRDADLLDLAVAAAPGPAADGAAVTVEAKRTSRAKCDRCWMYRADVGHDPSQPGLCARCTGALAARS